MKSVSHLVHRIPVIWCMWRHHGWFQSRSQLLCQNWTGLHKFISNVRWANSSPLSGSHAVAFNQHNFLKKIPFLRLSPLFPLSHSGPVGWQTCQSRSFKWPRSQQTAMQTQEKKKEFPEYTAESLKQEDAVADFYALTLSQAEAFKLMHILQKFKGRKSERKSEHMTLLKDTPQLAFCIGFAWQTPGAVRKILWEGRWRL